MVSRRIFFAVTAMGLALCASCSKAKPPATADSPSGAQAAQSATTASAYSETDYSIKPESASLNSKGFESHQMGDYQEAARLFAQAKDSDGLNATAWYNLACTLALQFAKDKNGSRAADIDDALEKSLTLDSPSIPSPRFPKIPRL